MSITIGDAIKHRLLHGMALGRDERGAFVEYDTIRLIFGNVGFTVVFISNGAEIFSNPGYGGIVPIIGNSFELTNLEGRVRVAVSTV